ncbi:hypothetical protein EJ05DRAFT_502999 [Pseudovirgaria hyperparasitica]|uniref:Uncharacterized protein n=1 Tax=Pseudovirgaria hyperparasitica TaxID=470096 RepID=A0A6A6W0N5_9PEZI|nr:uncharacterized protein EJ05DRAFT_502999 [Pseudovirgaria hyperparasitica]KAF2755544.1 hypothetical protein EJ05DRAFT_502999 [Pseudovirgaria hyperparasitica]
MVMCSRGVLLKVDEHLEESLLARAETERMNDPTFPHLECMDNHTFFMNCSDDNDSQRLSRCVETLKKQLGGAVTVFDWDYVSDGSEKDDEEIARTGQTQPTRPSNHPDIVDDTANKGPKIIQSNSPVDSTYDSDDAHLDMCEADLWFGSQRGGSSKKRKRVSSVADTEPEYDLEVLSPNQVDSCSKHKPKWDAKSRLSSRLTAHEWALEQHANVMTAMAVPDNSQKQRAYLQKGERRYEDFVKTLVDPRADAQHQLGLCPLDHYFDLGTGMTVDDGVSFRIAKDKNTRK